MTSPKLRRGLGLLSIFTLLAIAAWLILTALQDNIVYFYDPSDLVNNPATTPSPQERIRVGGLVLEEGLNITGQLVTFTISDGQENLNITYDGILPDLFRAGQGVIAEGHYNGTRFVADTILAKHDERYIPKEIADSLKEQGLWQNELGQNK